MHLHRLLDKWLPAAQSLSYISSKTMRISSWNYENTEGIIVCRTSANPNNKDKQVSVIIWSHYWEMEYAVPLFSTTKLPLGSKLNSILLHVSTETEEDFPNISRYSSFADSHSTMEKQTQHKHIKGCFMREEATNAQRYILKCFCYSFVWLAVSVNAENSI